MKELKKELKSVEHELLKMAIYFNLDDIQNNKVEIGQGKANQWKKLQARYEKLTDLLADLS